MRQINWGWQKHNLAWASAPRAVLDEAGEAYIDLDPHAEPSPWWPWQYDLDRFRIAVRAKQEGPVTVWLFLPTEGLSGMARIRFRVNARADAAGANAQREFNLIKSRHYSRLLAQGVPGAAWFRAQRNAALRARDEEPSAVANLNLATGRDQLEESYDLFSGGRAISENLQLDRDLLVATDDQRQVVPLESLRGITIRELDWQALTKDISPKLDPLAAYIPADQHALFCPTFSALLELMDEAERLGSPIGGLLQSGAEDQRLGDRYRRQLCVETTALARLLGPYVIQGVAITGSDPYLATGSDLAILFETQNAALLVGHFRVKQDEARRAYRSVKEASGEVAGIAYQGVRSPDRKIYSYLATVGSAVVVTNSLVQLERLAAAYKGREPNLASLDEYKFFRHRYPRGAGGESAFLMLSDATIRRWCGPRWRIASSRRTRAAAFLAELQAEYHAELVKGELPPEGIEFPRRVPGLGDLLLAPEGVRSSTYGSLEYQTPIVELALAKVTEAEAQAYNRWRDGYSRNWQWAFDPIGVQMSVSPKQVSVDLSVIPLIIGSEYRPLIDIAGKAVILRGAGDPHADAIFHGLLALDRQSQSLRQLDDLGKMVLRDVTERAVTSWVGSCGALYIDDDPIWKEFATTKDPEGFWRERRWEVPLALYVESVDQEKASQLIKSLAMLLESLGGIKPNRQELEYQGQKYLKVDHVAPQRDTPAFFLAATPKALIISPNERTLQRAIDRELQAAQPPSEQPTAWLGRQFCIRLKPLGFSAMDAAFNGEFSNREQARCWSNLWILNEWKHRFPNKDPLAVHERLWQTRLVCPGGGKYVWNEQWQTMESTVFGHPGQPRAPRNLALPLAAFRDLNLGITFENDGLRARAELQRASPQESRP